MRAPWLPAILVAVLAAPASDAADQKAIDAAVKRGADYLAKQYQNIKPGAVGDVHGIGPVAISGLALLESGRTSDDPTVKAIATTVRDAAFGEVRTYQISLCLLFLDRLGNPADEPLIQMLGVRLLAGQNANGGWTYNCVDTLPQGDEQRLRARFGNNQLVAGERGTAPAPMPKANPAAPKKTEGKLLPEIERHHQGLLANVRNGIKLPDDNSNTQFGILAVWVARKHGVPCEHALEAIEKRFLLSQTPSGGWPYSGLIAADGSPSMTCAGLLGLATAVGRREERRLQAQVPKKPDLKPMVKDPNDPFFAAPKPEPKKPAAPPKNLNDPRDRAVQAGLDNLAAVLEGGPVNRGRNPFRGGGLRDKDLYFLWSLERVGVVFGLQKIGRTDWYQAGADKLLPEQEADGSWAGGYGSEVDTSFALLFLAKSNLVRDLSAKVQRDPLNTELRSTQGPAAVLPEPKESVKPEPVVEVPMPRIAPLPAPTAPAVVPATDDSGKLADALLRVPALAWKHSLEQIRDGKGADFTKALVIVIDKVDGDRKKEARAALADRLTRMSADTLRAMLKGDDVELRRAAALACAMKDDRTHIPDLIDRISEDNETVVRAARAALKSLSGGKDFGPDPGFSPIDRAASVEEWKAWWAKQKK
jgi:hypothetical protein